MEHCPPDRRWGQEDGGENLLEAQRVSVVSSDDIDRDGNESPTQSLHVR